MIKNFFKTAIRSLLKYKVYSILNIIGLSIGIACAIVMYLQVSYDLSFDTFHQAADRIYRINMITSHENETEYDPGTPFPFARTLRQEYPNLEKVAQVVYYGGLDIYLPGKSDRAYEQKHIIFTEPDAIGMFEMDWLMGNPDEALKSPDDVVLSISAAKRLFGEMPLNQIMDEPLIIAGQSLRVAGIVEDNVSNTEIPWQVLVPTSLQEHLNPFYTPDDFSNVMSECQTFVRIPEGFDVSLWEAQLAGFTEKYMSGEDAANIRLVVQPLTDVHFNEQFDTFVNKPVSKASLMARSLVALLILIIACVNFINLATAQSANRSKEVGVRKVMGSSQRMLVGQFLTETLVIVIMSLLLSLVLAELMIINFGTIINFPSGLSVMNSPGLIPYALLLMISLTLLGGFYPAMIMSRFHPLMAMKRNGRSTTGGKRGLRNVLVIFQFAITQVMIVGTIVAVQQMDYFKTKPLGFDRQAILQVSLLEADSTQIALLNKLWSQHSFVEKVSFASASPNGHLNIGSRFGYPASAKGRDYQGQIRIIDENYLGTFGLSLIAGEELSYNMAAREILINETTARLIGHEDPFDAVGDQIFVFGEVRSIRGVIADFHVKSLHTTIEPVILVKYNQYIYSAGIRLKGADMVYDKQVISTLEEDWRQVFPASTFSHQAYEEYLSEEYDDEQKTADLLKILAVMAIVIGCLGLYGLIAFMANQKVKEIGVRKVLGASVTQIIWLFSSQFIKLIGLSFLIALPVAYYTSSSWLERFPYTIDLSPAVFLATLTGTVVIGIGAIILRAWSAAVVNPAISLKDE